MATDHRGRVVGNPNSAHGGFLPPPPEVQLGRTDYLEYDPSDDSFGVHWRSGDYESQPAKNLVYADGPRAGYPLDMEHLKEVWDSSHPDNMFGKRHVDIAFKPDNPKIVVPDPYGEDVPTDTLGRY